MLRSREESLSKKTMPEFRLRLKSGGKPPKKKERKRRERIEDKRTAARAARIKRRKAQCFHSSLLRSRRAGDKRGAARGGRPAALCPGAAGATEEKKGAAREDVLAALRALRRGRERSAQGIPLSGTFRRPGLDMLGCRCPIRDGRSKTGSQPPLHGRGMDSRHGTRVPSTRPEWQHKQPTKAQGLERGSEGAEAAASHRAEGFTPPPPPPPEEDNQDRTQEEVAAQAQRDAAQEEDSYNKQLWDQAIRTAMQDCRALVDNDLQETYLKKLQELFAGQGSEEGGAPDVVVQRLACLCAWWKQCGRPLEGDSGDLEFAILKVPGQKVACIRTRIEGPSYCNPRNARRCMVASELGEMCPHNTVDGEYPMYGFSARGTCAELSTENIRLSIAKVASRAKGIGQIIATFEGTLEQATPQTEGGMSYLSTSCRDAGSARSGDHLLLSPAYAVRRAISTPWPV